ncbi:hypothetical protein [Aeromonas veronii]|uniref:hypothetical protein n=1 Tax=Aeromonas veronii TaxID=654 RepID=UPI00130220DF|nr:hypothetical protein [Aeromonas veronii]KAE9625347.1 hypothetical protein GO627_08155 [Aeromonas veronii]
MSIQNISVKTAQGVKKYRCVLINKERSIYSIVDAKGKNSPLTIEIKHDRAVEIFFFNGLRIQNNEVFTFTLLTEENYKLGTLYNSTTNS